MPIDSKLTNVIGVKMPFWIVDQFNTRSHKGSLLQRDTNNLQYLSNKTAWVRLVSSIDLKSWDDIKYFRRMDPSIRNSSDLAKNYVLFGGTSIYQNKSYEIRSGFHNIGQDRGSYGILGEKEVQDFGYRPMPGLTRVSIETQGRYGAIRQATIDIKCWTKSQLDIIDALYFKLGYSMFLEWGHTYYYPNENQYYGLTRDPNVPLSSELSIIDPFSGLSKEELLRKISQNCRNSYGNYDAMLGIVTNFNFSYNQEGGYDCSIRLMGLGVLGDSLKINNPSSLIDIFTDEVLILKDTIEKNQAVLRTGGDGQAEDDQAKVDQRTWTYDQWLAKYNLKLSKDNTAQSSDLVQKPGFTDSQYNYSQTDQELADDKYANNIITVRDYNSDSNFFGGAKVLGEYLGIRRFNGFIPITGDYRRKIVLDSARFSDIFIRRFLNSPGRQGQAVALPQVVNAQPGNSLELITYEPKAEFAARLDALVSKSLTKSEAVIAGVGSGLAGALSVTFAGANVATGGLAGAITVGTLLLGELVLGALDDQNILEIAAETSNLESEEIIYGPFKNQDVSVPLLPIPPNTSLKFGILEDFWSLRIRRAVFATLDQSQISTLGQPKKTLYNPKDKYLFVTNQEFANSLLDLLVRGDLEFEVKNIEVLREGWNQPRAKNALKNPDSSLQGSLRILRDLPQVEGVKITLKGFLPIKNYRSSTGTYTFPVGYSYTEKVNNIDEVKTIVEQVQYKIPIEIDITDTSLIKDFVVEGWQQPIDYKSIAKIELAAEQERIKKVLEEEAKRDEKERQNALISQISEALATQSNLELILRTIQVSALNQALYQNGADKVDLSLGGKIYKFNIADRRNTPGSNKNNLLKTIFSNGVYQDIIEDLLSPDKITDSYADYISKDSVRLKINAKYGFATTLMGSDTDDKDIFSGLESKYVDYKKEILKAYVVPYDISTDLVAGIKANHPVYIPFGLLLMVLNHCCTLYEPLSGQNSDEDNTKDPKKPLVYIDYNTKLNFFQTCAEQMSTNPWVTLMRVECSKSDFKNLFNKDVLEGDKIKAQTKPAKLAAADLFDPQNEDRISFTLPEIKVNPNTGKLMNILLNVDHLIDLVKTNATKDGVNSVYLRPFLEEVLTNVNKYLGNYNLFRLNYSEKSNTFQIVDDQYTYTDIDIMTPVNAIERASQMNRTEIPLLGLDSVAKTLEIKTEIASRLGNLLAISANPAKQQAQNSVNADSAGFINDNFEDRIIPKRIEPGGSGLNGEIASAQHFNQTIRDFYKTVRPSKSDVSQATAYLIDKISKRKNDSKATRATAMIPLGVNFSTDGIGGMSMYQTFTVSNQLLPYTYESKKLGSLINGQDTYVGFVVVGLAHTIENNIWTTSLRSNMIGVKDKTVFQNQNIATPKDNGVLTSSEVPGILPPTSITPNADEFRNQIATLQKKYGSDRVRITGDLSSWADITKTLADSTIKLVDAMLEKFPDLKLEGFTGNDRWHATMMIDSYRKNPADYYKGPHPVGRGMDFSVPKNSPYYVPWSDETSKKIDPTHPNYKKHTELNSFILEYAKRPLIQVNAARIEFNVTTGIQSVLDEYVQGSFNATAGHFHVTSVY